MKKKITSPYDKTISVAKGANNDQLISLLYDFARPWRIENISEENKLNKVLKIVELIKSSPSAERSCYIQRLSEAGGIDPMLSEYITKYSILAE